jgi:tetratricopeptide (TPR) repeat protein
MRAPVRLKYTDFLMRGGSLDEARRRLAEITTKAPDYIPGWIESMRLDVTQHRYDDCLADATKILARDPTNYDAMERRAGVKLSKGDTDGAIADLKVAQGYFPQAPLIKYQLALAYLKEGDDTTAEENLRKAIQLAPSYDDALILLAGIRVQKGDSNSVISELAPVLKRHPGEARIRLLLAQAYRHQGNLGQAVAIFETIAAASPSVPSGPYLIGMALFEEGKHAEARAAFERSIKISEDYWPAQEMLVNMDLIDKRPAQAAERVAALVGKYPGVSDPWVLQFRVRLAQDDNDGAAADLQKAIELNPGSQYAYLHLAELYFKTNQAEKALERMNTLASKTNSKSAWMMIGMIQEQLKNFDAARAAYEKLLAIDPKFEPALNNLAFLYSERSGQVERAYGLAAKARELAPDDPIAADTLGWILFRRHDYLGALPLVQVAADKYPTELEIQYHLGMVYYMLGQDEPARQAFKRAAAAVAESPAKEDAAGRLAVLAIDPENTGAAVRADLERRAREQADDPMLLARLGRIQELDGNAAAAAESYETALKIAPRTVQTMLSLIGLYGGSLNNPGRARELAQTVHQLMPNDAQISWRLAKLAFGTGDFAWSATLLEQAAQDVSEPGFYNDSAYALYCSGRQRDAEAELQKIGADAPAAEQERARRLSAMMTAAQDPSSAQAAAGAARGILAQDPAFIPALMVSALAREQEGDVPGARKAYEDLLARAPEFPLAMRQLALLYGEKIGDDKKAEELAAKARKILPEDPALDYELGAVRYRQGDYSEAARYLQQGLAAKADQPETLFLLGMSHFQLKNTVQSREELQQALELKLPDREAEAAKRVLADLQRSEGAN